MLRRDDTIQGDIERIVVPLMLNANNYQFLNDMLTLSQRYTHDGLLKQYEPRHEISNNLTFSKCRLRRASAASF